MKKIILKQIDRKNINRDIKSLKSTELYMKKYALEVALLISKVAVVGTFITSYNQTILDEIYKEESAKEEPFTLSISVDKKDYVYVLVPLIDEQVMTTVNIVFFLEFIIRTMSIMNKYVMKNDYIIKNERLLLYKLKKLDVLLNKTLKKESIDEENILYILMELGYMSENLIEDNSDKVEELLETYTSYVMEHITEIRETINKVDNNNYKLKQIKKIK